MVQPARIIYNSRKLLLVSRGSKGCVEARKKATQVKMGREMSSEHEDKEVRQPKRDARVQGFSLKGSSIRRSWRLSMSNKSKTSL